MLRVVILVLALGAGGCAAWLAFMLQSNAAPAATLVEQVLPVPTRDVLVASADLAQGKALSVENVHWQPWPEELLHASFIDRSVSPGAIEVLTGSVVRNQLVSGEPVRQDKLVRSDSGFLATILAPGKRAVAVRVTAQNTAGGFILPNDRVDVIHTRSRPSASGENESVSITLLTNIRVLAIDQSADETSTGADSSTLIGQTATLELESRQAEIVIAAEASGMLLLALRSAADAAEAQQERRSVGFVQVFRAGRGEIVQLR